MKTNFLQISAKTTTMHLQLPLMLALLPFFLSISINPFFIRAEVADKESANATFPRTNSVVIASSSAVSKTFDKATNGDSNTRWSTGVSQSPSLYFQVDNTPGWRQITSPGPVARGLHTAVFDANRRQAIIFGGVQAGFQPLGDLWSFSLNSETWQPIFVNGDQPRPLWASAAISDQPRDRMVLFFGFDQYVTERGSPEVWALSYETRQWSRLASGPTGRFDAAVATDGTRAWIHGGFTMFPLTPDNTLGDLWEFDLEANTWRQLPNNGAAPPPTTNANLAYYQGALYLVGGHNATTITPGTWRYDLAGRQWEQLSPAGAPAVWAHHARAVDDSCGTLLLMGGDNDDKRDVPYLEALQMNSNPRYVRLPGEIPDVSRHHSAAALDPSTRQLIVFGGWRGASEYLGDTWIYTLGSCPTVTRSLFDFDGDGKADVSVFRPENGTWYLNQSASGFAGVQFGINTDKIVPADYDGDGKTDVAVFRNGIWYIQRSQLGFVGVTFGDANDIPVPADYDGDGKADVAVFRPSNGVWYLQRSSLGFTGIAFGQAGDKPVAAADYDGDGKADIAVYRNGTWYIQRSQLGFTGIAFGESTDKPVPADYDGDGKADVAVFRPSNGTWYLQRSQLGFTGIAFGLGTDLPVPADYDGDGKADVAVFRNGTWYLQRSQAGFTGITFGAATDKPAPNAFIP